MRRRPVVVVVLANVLLGHAAPAGAAPQAPPESSATAQADERVTLLIDALKTSESFKARATAAVALGRLGDIRATAPLTDALRSDEHYAVRVAAASALGRLPTPNAIPALFAGLNDQDPYVRDEAQRALTAFHTAERIGPFADAVLSSDPGIRWAGVRAYAAVAGSVPSVGPTVVAALGDEDEQIRALAETALGGLPGAAAVPLIIEGLRSGGSEVRGACARLAARHTDPRTVEPLIALLTSTDDAEDVRQAARAALNAHAAHLDKAALQADARTVAPEKRDARIRAVRVLAAVDDALAPGLIEAAIRDVDPIVRVGAGRAALDLPGGRGQKIVVEARERETDARAKKMFELILKNTR